MYKCEFVLCYMASSNDLRANMTNSFSSIALEPIVNTKGRELAHYEALLRLAEHPLFGSSHAEFIKTAERDNWIYQIDLFVLREVLSILRNSDLRIACNLSPRTIECASAKIFSILEKDPRARTRLIFEITETIPVVNLEAVAHFSEAAKDMGCSIALDDYGNDNGFISVDLIKRITPNYLKLDRSVTETKCGREFVMPHVLDLAAQLNIEIIAEYVDTEAKLDFVISCGIRYAQGALFGLAMPAPPAHKFIINKTAAYAGLATTYPKIAMPEFHDFVDGLKAAGW